MPAHQKLSNFIGRAEKPLAASLCMCAYKDNVFMYSFELIEKATLSLAVLVVVCVACIFYKKFSFKGFYWACSLNVQN